MELEAGTGRHSALAAAFTAPWSGLIHCNDCNYLHKDAACPQCGLRLDLEPKRFLIDGIEHVVFPASQGAIPWSTFVLLNQLRYECIREAPPALGVVPRVSPRFAVVLLFWTMFEVLMDGFYRAALADLPGQLSEELLGRFTAIGSRLDRLHKRIWGTNFWDDLEGEGYVAEAALLRDVQKQRNAFMHGDPEAIDDDIVHRTILHLLRVQEGWIVLFNKRCTGRQERVPVWTADKRGGRKQL